MTSPTQTTTPTIMQTTTQTTTQTPSRFPLPSLADQAERLIELGVVPAPAPDGRQLSADDLRSAARRLEAMAPAGSLLVVHPRVVPPSALAPHLRLTTPDGERPGFVVVDMHDVDDFAPVEGVEVPDADVYAVAAPDRGDEMANWAPEEAQPAIDARGRTPLTLAEGIHWVLQAPGLLERNLCFMTIGSRLRKPNGRFDARTPAIWISNGTGRDGRERRGAPKVGWCWWRNRHTWLGFASAEGRVTTA